MYVKMNLGAPTGISAGAGSGKDQVTIVLAEDVAVFPPRDASGVKMVGNFVMKPGAKMITLYTTKSKGEAPVTTDGDEDSISIKQMFNTQHPGNRLECKEFVQNWLGKNVYILHKACQDDFFEVMGTPCAPLQLKPEKTDTNDARFWAFKFEAFAKSAYVPGHYEGELVLAAPFAVVNATELVLTEDNGSHYKLPATSSATSIAVDGFDFSHGKYITLIGSGGSTPATFAQGSGLVDVVMKNGTTWTALEGAVIQFQVYQAGATTYLFELSRG
jgi:hypothetical protein